MLIVTETKPEVDRQKEMKGMKNKTTRKRGRTTEEDKAEKLSIFAGNSSHSSKEVSRDCNENILAKATVHCPNLGWAPCTGRISQFFTLFPNPTPMFKSVTQSLLHKGSRGLHSCGLEGARDSGRAATVMRAARSKHEGQFWETLARQLLGGKSQFLLFAQPWVRALKGSKC